MSANKGPDRPRRWKKRPEPSYDSLENIHKDVHGIRKQILDAIDALSRKLDAGEPRQILERLEAIFNQGVELMATFKEFAETQKAHNARQGAAIDQVVASQGGIVEDVKGLKDLIAELQTNPGTFSPEDEATAAELTTAGDALATKVEAVAAALKALDEMTPPPVVTPTP